MGATKALGCLVFLLFSGYLLLQAERGRRFLVGERENEAAAENQTASFLSGDEVAPTEDPFWKSVGINVFLLVGTFLCYDLVVANILVFSLTTDSFFRRVPLRLALSVMVGVLAAAAWHELPPLRQAVLQDWIYHH